MSDNSERNEFVINEVMNGKNIDTKNLWLHYIIIV